MHAGSLYRNEILESRKEGWGTRNREGKPIRVDHYNVRLMLHRTFQRHSELSRKEKGSRLSISSHSPSVAGGPMRINPPRFWVVHGAVLSEFPPSSYSHLGQQVHGAGRGATVTVHIENAANLSCIVSAGERSGAKGTESSAPVSYIIYTLMALTHLQAGPRFNSRPTYPPDYSLFPLGFRLKTCSCHRLPILVNSNSIFPDVPSFQAKTLESAPRTIPQ